MPELIETPLGTIQRDAVSEAMERRITEIFELLGDLDAQEFTSTLLLTVVTHIDNHVSEEYRDRFARAFSAALIANFE